MFCGKKKKWFEECEWLNDYFCLVFFFVKCELWIVHYARIMFFLSVILSDLIFVCSVRYYWMVFALHQRECILLPLTQSPFMNNHSCRIFFKSVWNLSLVTGDWSPKLNGHRTKIFNSFELSVWTYIICVTFKCLFFHFYFLNRWTRLIIVQISSSCKIECFWMFWHGIFGFFDWNVEINVRSDKIFNSNNCSCGSSVYHLHVGLNLQCF